MKRHTSILLSMALGLLLAGSAFAQGKAGTSSSDTPAIESASKNLFTGMARGDMASVFENTSVKYANRKLVPDRVRLPETGPKVSVEWDGSVKIVRSDPKTAVVEAKFYRPLTDELPEGEIGRLRVYMEKQHGAWVASAPSRRQTGDDSGTGGWYHAGFFTFCPNRGIVYTSNHFSADADCTSVGACR